MRRAIITGFGGHGKDTLCEYLRDQHGISFCGSSWYSCKAFIFFDLAPHFGYESPEACYLDRHNHRALWYEKIKGFNADDKSRLGRSIFADHDIYCGIRDKEELHAIRATGLTDLVVWVDALKRKPPEPESSMNISQSDCDFFIDNNGVVEDLYSQADELVSLLRPRQQPQSHDSQEICELTR